MRTAGKALKVLKMTAMVLSFSAFMFTANSFAASKTAIEFTNTLQTLFTKRGLPIKVKLIKDKPYNLSGFREVVIEIKNRKRIYITNGKLVIPAIFDIKHGVNLIKKDEMMLNRVNMSRFSTGEYNRIIGKKDAKIKIVLFSDYECPFCKRLWPYLVKLPKQYDVAIYYKNFPLPFHKQAMILSQISEAVRIAAGKKIDNYIYTHSFSGSNEDVINRVIKDQGLTKQAAKIRKLIKSKQVKDAIAKDMAEGKAVSVNGTPTLFVDGYRVVGDDINSLNGILKQESK